MREITYFDFGQWVIVDMNQHDQRQVIQYDPLNKEYTLDKEGKWDYIAENRVSEIN